MKIKMRVKVMVLAAAMTLTGVFGSVSGAYAAEWKQEGKNWTYVDKGTKQTGWQKISGKWYYFNDKGIMQTGWIKVGGKWYFLNSSGAMQTGWIKVGGKWYFLNSSGAMQTGWIKVGGKWYFLNSNGTMKTGWLKSRGVYYYLDKNGVMATGRKTINGKTFVFRNDGGLKLEASIMTSAKGLFSMSIVDADKTDSSITVRFTNNLPGAVSTVGYPTTVIDGQSVGVDAFKNGFNMNVSIAASSYKDVKYVVDQSFFNKGGLISVNLMTEYLAFGNMETYMSEIILY